MPFSNLMNHPIVTLYLYRASVESIHNSIISTFNFKQSYIINIKKIKIKKYKPDHRITLTYNNGFKIISITCSFWLLHDIGVMLFFKVHKYNLNL